MLTPLLALALTAPLPGPSLSDAELVRLAAAPFDKRAKMGRHEVLGVHRGVRVLADYPCGDICPDYTVRIVHYEAAPGGACEKAGGVSEPRRYVLGIAAVYKAYCIPKPLAGKADALQPIATGARIS